MERILEGRWLIFIRMIALSFSLFQLYTAGFGFLPDMQQRAVHVAFASFLTFALFPFRQKEKGKGKIPFYDLILMGLVILPCVHVMLKYEWYSLNFGVSTPADIVGGILLITLVLEAGRRTTGLIFPCLTLFVLLYALYGSYFPGDFRHPGLKLVYVVRNLYQSWNGIWGFITGVSATIIAIFIIFGSIINRSGAGNTFIDLANKAAGRMVGGPALVAVVASGLFGTISGSAAANVATTGNFTIPLMKRLGYRPEFAGGVEAIASSGGQLAPPIMGVGAFIMAELLGISYLRVIVAASIPAFLYYLAVFTAVRFEALRLNLPPIPREEIVPLRQILTWKKLVPLFGPIVLLFVALYWGFSVTFSGFLAIAGLIILATFADFSPANIRRRIKGIIPGLEEGAIALLPIVSLCVCANIIIAIVNQTGLGMKLTGFILSAAEDFLPMSLVISAAISLILGMGLPTAGAYMLTVTIVGPALMKLGILPLAAHLFVFYFAVLSAVTPPVCIAVFTGAGIAGAAWLGVANVALRLGIVAYFVPFVFVFNPALIMVGTAGEILPAVVTASLGAVAMGAASMGYFTRKLPAASRILLLAAAAVLIIPGVKTDLIGLGLLILAFLYSRFVGRMGAGLNARERGQ
jgi:TRAP transporter 4TM/12TM fusion protein